jgi:ABC-type phosphate transport system substrate-binding protein
MPPILSMLRSCVLGLALLLPAAWGAERPFAVIVGPSAAEHRLTRESLALIFKRKQNYWENGTRVLPVNLPPTHALRRAFSLSVLGNAPEAMEDYWREMYFHGVLPPHVLESEEAVILFVNSTPGAIGYISGCPADRKINVAMTFGELPSCTK